MREKQKELYYSYILNQRTYLEQDIQELQSRIRYRTIGITDLVELLIAKTRYETFCEVTRDINYLLNIENGRKSKK